jgi:hypothetical protein
VIKLLSGLSILVLISLLISGCPSVNQPPLISNLTVSSKWVDPSGSRQVKCFAQDPDGDELSYAWSASGGSIYGEGSKITWTAPETLGDYTITVTVTDGRGGEDAKELTLVVVVNHPPLIVSLTAEWQSVPRAIAVPIECIAQDPDGDELSYAWSASGGNISGEGPTVTWTAPNTYGTYTITVTATDSTGGEAIQSIDIVVSCCH